MAVVLPDPRILRVLGAAAAAEWGKAAAASTRAGRRAQNSRASLA